MPDPSMENHLAEFAGRGMVPSEPIEASVDIAAAAAHVWTVITESGNLTNVHPFCESNDVERWPGVDGSDHVRYYGGVHYRRDVLAWRDGEGYDLAVGPPSGATSVARWWIEPAATDTCRFGIEVTSFLRDSVDAETRARYEDTVIKAAIPPYLEAVVLGVAHYCETGVPVARNQFGAHEIYSPPTP